MTVTSTTARSGPYAGNGSTTQFPYTFRILDEAHLTVVKTAADGTETTLVLTTDYTVSGVGNASGGNVTTTSAPASGETLTILRGVPLTQETDWTNQGPFFAETVEESVDKLTMIAQQFDERLDRAIVLPENSTLTDLEMPAPAALNVLRWNAAETGLENWASVVDIGTVAAISSDITTVSGISANVTTVAGISSDVTTVATNVADVTNFADVYQGPKASDPTLRNDGSALQAGDLHFNTTSDGMRVYSDGSWTAVALPVETGANWGGTSGGSANAQTLSLTPVPGAYAAGMTIEFIVGTTNTGPTTLNVNSLGTRNVYFGNAPLSGGELIAGDVVAAIYDGTQFQIIRSGVPSGGIVQVITASTSTQAVTTSAVQQSTNLSATVTPKYDNSDLWIMVTGELGAQQNNSSSANHFGNLTIRNLTDAVNVNSMRGGRQLIAATATAATSYAPAALVGVYTVNSTAARTFQAQINSPNTTIQTLFPHSGTAFMTVMEIRKA